MILQRPNTKTDYPRDPNPRAISANVLIPTAGVQASLLFQSARARWPQFAYLRRHGDKLCNSDEAGYNQGVTGVTVARRNRQATRVLALLIPPRADITQKRRGARAPLFRYLRWSYKQTEDSISSKLLNDCETPFTVTVTVPSPLAWIVTLSLMVMFPAIKVPALFHWNGVLVTT